MPKLLLSLMLLCGAANAERPTLAKLKTFMAKSGKCQLALTYAAAMKKGQKGDDREAIVTLCFLDSKLGAGTINERQVCAFAFYSPEHDEYDLVSDTNAGRPYLGLNEYITKTPCLKGGIAELMSTHPQGALDHPKTLKAAIANTTWIFSGRDKTVEVTQAATPEVRALWP